MKVTLYKEIITRTGRGRGGFRAPFQSIRASIAPVDVSIDGISHRLASTEPAAIELHPGDHEIIANGLGFARAREVVPLRNHEAILAISPDYQSSITRETPLGSLRIHLVNGPEDLQPYRFYEGLPTSFGRRGVGLSVFLSMAASGFLLLIGAFGIGAAVWGFVARDSGVGFVLTLFAVLLATAIPMGVGGLVTAVRFLRLPPSWRDSLDRASSEPPVR